MVGQQSPTAEAFKHSTIGFSERGQYHLLIHHATTIDQATIEEKCQEEIECNRDLNHAT